MIIIFNTQARDMIWIYYNIRGRKFLFTSLINFNNLYGIKVIKNVNISNYQNNHNQKSYK